MASRSGRRQAARPVASRGLLPGRGGCLARHDRAIRAACRRDTGAVHWCHTVPTIISCVGDEHAGRASTRL
jgi:hypothetical protein